MTIAEPRVFQRNRGILKRINSANASELHILYEPTLVPIQLNPIDDYFNGFIQDLRIKIAITSLDEVGFPNLEPELTRAERLVEYSNIEWNNPRYELEILKSLNGVDYFEIARLSLQHRSPYYSIDLLPYFTKQADAIVGNEWIACKVNAVGWGTLQGSDELVIFGSLQLQAHHFVGDVSNEPALPSVATTARNFRLQLVEGSQLVIPANPDRKGLFITMTGYGRAYFSLGATAVIGEGLFMNGRGSVINSDRNSLWQGDIYAIPDGNGSHTFSCIELT